MKRNIYLIILILIGCHSLNAQRLTYSQLTKKVSNLTVPEDRSVLVFESDLDLSFKSSMERLVAPVKKGNLYYVTVTERICIITVINNVTKSEMVLPFGQLSENTLPTIPKGEYVVFKIEENNQELIVLNQTEVKKREGLNDNQMLYEKEALLILNVDPFDLELEFESTQAITDIKHSGKQYKIYIKPVKQEIIVKQKESDAQGIIQIQHLEPKEVQYYYVSLPEYLRKREVIYDKNISVGDYLIESVPSGAVIEIFGNPSFNSEKNRTPFLLKGFEAGYKIITLSLPEYETISDTIQIGSNKKNKSHYDLIPQFAFINIDIEPPFPYPSLYVDQQPYSVQNKQNIKIPVSSKEVEIKAQHFESELFTINPTPGEIIYITKKLNPILGKLYLECGKNAEKGKVYVSNPKFNIDRKLLGTLPIQETLILQEGQYELIVEKEGYGVFKKTVQITKQQLRRETVTLGLTQKVEIITYPSNAAIYIDGFYVGKSNKKINLSIGSLLTIVKEGYENHHEKITFLPETGTLFIQLDIKHLLCAITKFGSSDDSFFGWDENFWIKPQTLPLLFIDGQYIGALYNHHFNRHLPQLFSIKANLDHNIKLLDIKNNNKIKDFQFHFSEKGIYNNFFYSFNANFSNYWFRVQRVHGGLNSVILIKDQQYDPLKKLKKLKKSIKIVIKNHLNNPLSITSDGEILFFKRDEETYTLYLNPKIKSFKISENGTPFSRKFSFDQTFLLKDNEYSEINIYRDSNIVNTTLFVNDNPKIHNKKDKLINFVYINDLDKEIYCSIEGINTSYSHFFTLSPYSDIRLKLPEGLFRSTVVGGCEGTLDFKVDYDIIYEVKNTSSRNQFTILANSCIRCGSNVEVTTKNGDEKSNDSLKSHKLEFLNSSVWNGYYYRDDKRHDFEIYFIAIDTTVGALIYFQEDKVNGSFKLIGSYDPTTNKLTLKPFEWITQPVQNYQMFGFSGKFSLSNGVFRFNGTIGNDQQNKIFFAKKTTYSYIY